MGQFLVWITYATIVGAAALAIFLRAFPHPDRQTATIAIVVILIAVTPAAWRLWRDLQKTYTPPQE